MVLIIAKLPIEMQYVAQTALKYHCWHRGIEISLMLVLSSFRERFSYFVLRASGGVICGPTMGDPFAVGYAEEEGEAVDGYACQMGRWRGPGPT